MESTSLPSYLSSSTGSLQKVALAGMELSMGSATWISIHQCQRVYNLPAAETNTEHLIWHHSMGWSAATWWQADYTGLLCHGRGDVCSFWNRYLTLDTDLPSLHTMLLAKLQSVDLQNSLFTITVFHTALLLIKELTSKQMKCDNRPVFTEFAGLTMPPTILKQLAW